MTDNSSLGVTADINIPMETMIKFIMKYMSVTIEKKVVNLSPDTSVDDRPNALTQRINASKQAVRPTPGTQACCILSNFRLDLLKDYCSNCEIILLGLYIFLL
jgi:hypothetical protein